MIQLNSAKMTLSIILPNNNKALKQVIDDATPKELKDISASKDLKSVMTNILKQSANDPKQDKALLNLVKNNPTLKELANTNSATKELSQEIDKTLKDTTTQNNPTKTTDTLKTLQKSLQTIQTDIKDISDDKNFVKKLQNSGVFLESKIKDLQTPKMELKTTLQNLSAQLDTTSLPSVKEINTQLKNLLSSDIFKSISNDELLTKTDITKTQTDIKDLTQLTKKVDDIMQKLETRLNSNMDKTTHPNDTLFKDSTKKVLDKIQLLNKPEQLSTQTQTKEFFSSDLKSVLLKAQEDISNSNLPNKQELLKHIDKLTLQVDYHQLVSHLSNSSSLYIPYSWEALEDGHISIKNAKNNSYFCDIDLKLKDNGELKLRLGLFDDKSLNINITATDKDFKQTLKENLKELKKQIFSIGLTPKDIRFLDDVSLTHSYNQTDKKIDVGFEVKA